MNNPVYKRETCRLCGSKNIHLAVHFVPTPIGDDFVSKERLSQTQPTFPLDLLLCHDCGNVQLLNVVNPELIYVEYTYKSSVSLGLVEHFKRYAETVISKIDPPKDGLVVELGSNEGAMLRAFKEQGMRVLGVDPAREISRMATEAGVETWATYFTADVAEKIKKERGAASLVIANNVFANIDDVEDVVKGLRSLLSPDGVFVFETSYWLDVEQKMLIDTVFHEHLTYFAVKPLVSFFRRLGMEIIDVERVETKGGSLRGYVQLAGGRRKLAASVAAQIGLEDKAGLDKPETYKVLTSELDRLKAELSAKLGEYKTKGKSVAAYGAAVGLTTMIYHFELGKYIDFIVDDNPDKQNTFSPGLHIPTLPSEALYEKKPDVVIVLAWRYVDAIKTRHQKYLSEGGHFILPLPKVEVI